MSITTDYYFWIVLVLGLALVGLIGVLVMLLHRRNEQTASLVRDTAVSSAKIAEQLDFLDQQKQYIRATLDTALDAIVMMDHEGKITEFNPAAENIFGYRRREAVGARLADLIVPEEYREAHQKGLERYQKTGTKKVIDKRIEIEAVTREGGRIVIDLAITEWSSGKHPVYIGFMRDITDQKKSELALQAALDEARQGSEEKSRFLAMMSHEIRTPINGVLGVLGLLEDANLSKEQKRLVQTGASSANLLLDVVNDILDFSKIEADKLELENSHFLLADMVRPILDLMRFRIAGKSLELHDKIDVTVPDCLYGDAGRIRQVLLNLVSNATKFTEQGEIAINIQSRTDDDGRNWLRVDVSDTGIGIPEEKIGSLFREFATVDPSYSRKFGGSGLGLAIAKGLVELMDGRIGCQSIIDKGSVFWFEIPLVQGDLDKVSLQADAKDEDEAVQDHVQQRANKRVLLAEDNPANRMVVKAMIEKTGYRVTTVVDGREAVEAVRQIPYDLVLMDISMPGMDGIAATRAIRQMEGPRADIPIIAMTAHAVDGAREEFMRAGMNDYLPKPGRLSQILQKMDHWLLSEADHDETSQQAEKAIKPLDSHAISQLINIEALDNLAEDTDRKLVPRMVAGFIEDAQNRMERMQEAIRDENFAELELCSHALASSAATFGVSEGHFVARRLEAASMLENHGVCASELELLEENLEASISALKQVMLTWDAEPPLH